MLTVLQQPLRLINITLRVDSIRRLYRKPHATSYGIQTIPLDYFVQRMRQQLGRTVREGLRDTEGK